MVVLVRGEKHLFVEIQLSSRKEQDMIELFPTFRFDWPHRQGIVLLVDYQIMRSRIGYSLGHLGNRLEHRNCQWLFQD